MADAPELATLEEIQRRVLWLAVRMVDHANRERPPGEIKVGGHQASSASMVGIMTALWFGHLGRSRQGRGEAARLARVPRHQVPDRRARPLVPHPAARARRAAGVPEPDQGPRRVRLLDRVGRPRRRRPAVRRRRPPLPRRPLRRGRDPPARFIALAGDAELDEGNVWEAITDPALQGLGNVMLVVDANRQSLDRVVPDQKIKKLMEFFDGAGWHVVEAKYGPLLTAAFERPGGDALRAHIDAMSNEEYQSLFAYRGAELRRPLPRRRRRRRATVRRRHLRRRAGAARPEPRRPRPRRAARRPTGRATR